MTCTTSSLSTIHIAQVRSSGSLQLTLACAANLCYVALACEGHLAQHATKLRRRLADAVRDALGTDGTVDLEETASRRPDLEEQRVRYEWTRLLWGLLRLRILPEDRPKIREHALRALANATARLDVARASAGVVFENVAAVDLKLHQIRDLLAVVAPLSDKEITHGPGAGGPRGSPNEEPLRCFGSWILAHFTLRADDCQHVANQGGFGRLAAVVTARSDRGEPPSLLDRVEAAARRGETAGDAVLTLRLLARTLRNLAKNELTAALVAERALRDRERAAPGARELHALNRLVRVGWVLEVLARADAAPAEAAYVTTEGIYFKELAKYERVVHDDATHHHCVPFKVAGKKDARRRAAAPDLTVVFPDGSNEYAVANGLAPSSLRVLDDAASAMQHLSSHKQTREEFAAHGSLGAVVALALDGRFDRSAAFHVLEDAPREAVVRGVTLAPRESDIAERAPTRPRWLIKDVHGLILASLEGENIRASILALRFATRTLAHDYADGAEAHPHAAGVIDVGESDDDEGPAEENDVVAERPGLPAARAAGLLVKGDQIIVAREVSGDGPPRLSSGRCAKVHHGGGAIFVDAELDGGGVLTSVFVASDDACASAFGPKFDKIFSDPSDREHATRLFEDGFGGGSIVDARGGRPSFYGARAVAAPAVAAARAGGDRAVGASLFLLLARDATRLREALEARRRDKGFGGVAFEFLEAFTEVAKRYLTLGHNDAAHATLMIVAPLCRRHLAALAGAVSRDDEASPADDGCLVWYRGPSGTKICQPVVASRFRGDGVAATPRLGRG